jgi:2-iminobutanoate/2-iminopropanoate deaminase
MKKEIIFTESAPAPIGPYSQAVAAGHLLYLSGQVAINPSSGKFEGGDLETQTRLVMKNLEALLHAGGSSFAQVIKTTIFLAPGEEFDVVNRVYGEWFDGDFPARETVWVNQLPKMAKVEISMISVIPVTL